MPKNKQNRKTLWLVKSQKIINLFYQRKNNMTKLFISILTAILLTPLAYANNGQLLICNNKIIHITENEKTIFPICKNA